MNPDTERQRKAAWRIARRALETGAWAFAPNHVAAAKESVDMANIVTTSLAALGCFADKYGETGSFEIDIASGLVCSFMAAHKQATDPIHYYGNLVFQLVREMSSAGLLTDADRARCRTFEYDREQAEAAKRKSEQERQEAARKAAEDRAKRMARKRDALARLAEIEAEKKEGR